MTGVDKQTLEVFILRAVLAALLTFLLGNGTSYLVFGLHAASRADVEKIAAGQQQLGDRLGDRIDKLEQTVNEMKGVLRGKGIDSQ